MISRRVMTLLTSFAFITTHSGASTDAKQIRSDTAGARPAERSADSLVHLRRGSGSGFEYALRAVVGNSETFREMWARAIRGYQSPPPLPAVDFSRDMVVVVAMGMQTDDGYGIRIDSAVVHGEAIDVYVFLTTGANCIQGAEVTWPFDMVRVPKRFGVIVFHDRMGPPCKNP